MGKYDHAKTELYKFYEKNPDKSRKEIASHFIAMGYTKSSVYRWMRSIEENGTANRKVGSGRPAKIATKSNIQKIKRHFNHRSGRSQKRYARKLGCTRQYISLILKRYSNIKRRKKQKKPYLTPLQKKQARPKCRKMLEKYRDTDFLIDDESYFTLSHTSQSGNDCFYSDYVSKTPDSVKSNYKRKFEPKLLVYLCMAPKGVSKPFFISSGLSVNQEVYLEECIKKYLEPFIYQHYPHGGYIFWPDLASAHYASSVQNYLKSKNINYVPKWLNPANLSTTNHNISNNEIINSKKNSNSVNFLENNESETSATPFTPNVGKRKRLSGIRSRVGSDDAGSTNKRRVSVTCDSEDGGLAAVSSSTISLLDRDHDQDTLANGQQKS